MNLTKKQKAMLDFISGFMQGHGYSPTLREIMQSLDYKSVSTVAKHVDNLIAAGHLYKREGAARSLELVREEAEEPWWKELERQVKRRQSSEDKVLLEEAATLQKALDIVRQ